jgi:hypothetical protein
MHLVALRDVARVALDTLADWTARRRELRVKLH